MKEIKSIDEFNNIIKNNEKVLIKFYSISCAPCRKLAKLIDDSDLLNIIPIYKLDAIELGELSDKYSISAVPCILYFINGKPIHSFYGLVSIDKIKEMINDSDKMS